jgi:hypothetical protein
VKRHVLTDERGVPLSVVITGANVHDKWLVGVVLDAIVVRAARGPRRPKHLCLDKGYDFVDTEAAVRERGMFLTSDDAASNHYSDACVESRGAGSSSALAAGSTDSGACWSGGNARPRTTSRCANSLAE